MKSLYRKSVIVFLLTLFHVICLEGIARNTIVADSLNRTPMPGASVFDCHGKIIGICGQDGKMPYIPTDLFPVIVRYMGFKEKLIYSLPSDTVFLQENSLELPEVVVESRHHKLLHMLAYVREYSTLTTYTDTVFLFREKMVDYMLKTEPKLRFRGWTNPRVLNSRSYYRFTDASGMDSVSDECNYHFSWSDWVGIIPSTHISPGIKHIEKGSDTIRGKYSPTEIWSRNHDRINIDINILADTTSRKWVPNLSVFFKDYMDFDEFRVRFSYDNVTGDSITPLDLTGYSFNIESNGRGHQMFMFNRVNEPFSVSTYGEVYVLDKEFITVKEAKKWERLNINTDGFDIYEPYGIHELQASVISLIERVENIDKDRIRLAMVPDHRLAGRKTVRQNFGQRVLQLLKDATGISNVRAQRNFKRQWRELIQQRKR